MEQMIFQMSVAFFLGHGIGVLLSYGFQGPFEMEDKSLNFLTFAL